MIRKIIIVVAALVVPGALVALIGAWVVKSLWQNQRAKPVFALAGGPLPVRPIAGERPAERRRTG